MLTTQKCREILGPDCDLSEKELEALRNDLYAFADIITDEFIKRTMNQKDAK